MNPKGGAMSTTENLRPEPFVSADEAAEFLSIDRRFLLALARRGIAGAYPLGTGECRRTWVFRLTELAAAIASKNTVPHNGESVRSQAAGRGTER
jgi:hypothetical protein